MDHYILSCIDATGLNTFVTFASMILTVGSVWAAWFIGDRGRRTDRIHRVVAEFIRLQQLGVRRPSLGFFVDAGATTLTQSEMEEAGVLIREAGYPDPMNDPSFQSKGLIAEAKREGVDFGDFTSRVKFLISKLPTQIDDKSVDACQKREGGTRTEQSEGEELQSRQSVPLHQPMVNPCHETSPPAE